MNVGLRKLKIIYPQYLSTQKYNNQADPEDPRTGDREFLYLLDGL